MRRLSRHLVVASAALALTAMPAAALAETLEPSTVAVEQNQGMDAERVAGIGGAILLLAAMIQRDGGRASGG